MADPRTFRDTVKPALYVNMFLGIGFFEFSSNKRVKPFIEKIYASCYLVMIQTLYYLTVIASYRYDILLQTRESSTILIVWFTCTYQLSGLLLIAVRLNSDEFRKVIYLMEENDHRMETIGLSKEYRSKYKYQLRSIFGFILFCVFIVFCTWHHTLVLRMPLFTKILSCIGLNITTILCLTTNFTFCFLMRCVQFKFDQLNNLLRKMIETLDPPNQKRFLERSDDFEVKRFEDTDDDALLADVDTVRKIKISHLALIKIARQINTSYGIQILLTSCVILIRVVMAFYVFNKLMWHSPPNDQLVNYVLFPLLFFVINMSMMSIVYHNCMKTSSKAAETGDLLCRLYDSSTTIEFRDEIQRFALQVLQNPFLFTMCGLVDFDRSFISSALGNLCGYVIILIQVEMQRVKMDERDNLPAV